jgi:hypothetical protein
MGEVARVLVGILGRAALRPGVGHLPTRRPVVHLAHNRDRLRLGVPPHGRLAPPLERFVRPLVTPVRPLGRLGTVLVEEIQSIKKSRRDNPRRPRLPLLPRLAPKQLP